MLEIDNVDNIRFHIEEIRKRLLYIEKFLADLEEEKG